jgi:predicted nucleotidyltransferase
VTAFLTLDRARRLAARLVATDDRVRSVLLFGSVARSQAHVTADLDLLVFSTEPLHPSRMRALVPELNAGDVNVIWHTPTSLAELKDWDQPFVAHLVQEGILVGGTRELYEHLSDAPADPQAIASTLASWMAALDGFAADKADPGEVVLVAYAVAHQSIMLLANARPPYQWRRDAAFRAFAEASPKVAGAVTAIKGLRASFDRACTHGPAAAEIGSAAAQQGLVQTHEILWAAQQLAVGLVAHTNSAE